MRIYHFYIRDDFGVVGDTDGIELPDVVALLAEVNRSASELALEERLTTAYGSRSLMRAAKQFWSPLFSKVCLLGPDTPIVRCGVTCAVIASLLKQVPGHYLIDQAAQYN